MYKEKITSRVLIYNSCINMAEDNTVFTDFTGRNCFEKIIK